MKMEDPLKTILAAGTEEVGDVDEIGVGPDATSLDVMQAIYRSPVQPTNRRMRAAMAALPFEHPKLAVSVNTDATGFASQIEEIYRRSGMSNVIDAGKKYDVSAPLPIPKRLPQHERVETDPADQGSFRRRL